MSIKLSQDHISTFIRAANDKSLGWPLHLAPEILQKASASADDAYWKWVDASDAVAEAEFNLPSIQAKWNKDAEDAVRGDKDFPSTKELDRAKIKVKVTAEDAAQAKSELRMAEVRLTHLLEDDSIRDPWRQAVEEEAVKLQEKLAMQVEKINPVLAELSLHLGLSKYLGELGMYEYLPRVIEHDPRDGLREMLQAKPWAPTSPVGTISKL